MTPLDFAKELLADVVANVIEPPTVRFAQVGPQVVDCASIIAAVTNLDQSPIVNCACGRVTVVVTLTRDCANTANQDGTTNVAATQAVSESGDRDSMNLRTVAELYMEAEWSVGWTMDGGILITSLSLTVPLPC